MAENNLNLVGWQQALEALAEFYEDCPTNPQTCPNPSWKVQVFGERCGRAWEISVVRESNERGQLSWGWFNDDKLLVSHNGGPCDWPICGFVWDQQIAIATELCRRLNASEDVSAALAKVEGGSNG